MEYLIYNNLFIGHNTGSVESGKKYRPLFLDHFDKKEAPEIGKVRVIHFKCVCNCKTCTKLIC